MVVVSCWRRLALSLPPSPSTVASCGVISEYNNVQPGSEGGNCSLKNFQMLLMVRVPISAHPTYTFAVAFDKTSAPISLGLPFSLSRWNSLGRLSLLHSLIFAPVLLLTAAYLLVPPRLTGSTRATCL